MIRFFAALALLLTGVVSAAAQRGTPTMQIDQAGQNRCVYVWDLTKPGTDKGISTGCINTADHTWAPEISVTGILQGNGTAISAALTTGSGSVVLATSPIMSDATITGVPVLNGDIVNIVRASPGATGAPNVNLINTAGTNGAGSGILFLNDNSAASQKTAAFINGGLVDATAGGELGLIDFSVFDGFNALNRIITAAVSPGGTSARWGPSDDNYWDLGLSGFRFRGVWGYTANLLTSVTTALLNVTGASSGTVTIKPQAAAGTYNFNLPTAAGGSGQVMTSGGGGASPMTWTTLAAVATSGNAANLTGSSLPSSITASSLTSVGAYVQTGGSTIASLPTCNSGIVGASTYVTNAQTTPTYLGAVSTTGAVTAPVFCNGSGWVYH